MKMLCIFFIFLSSLAKASYETDTVKIRGNQSIAGNKTFTGNINLSALTGNCVLRSDGSDNLTCGGFDIDNSGNLTGVDGIFSGSVNANLILEMVSTTKASKPCPEMTTSERDALTPVNGSCIYNSTTLSYQFYNGTSWGDIGGGVSATSLNSKNVYFMATSNSGQTCFVDYSASPGTVANNTRIEYEDEITDSHNLYNPAAGRFTVDANTTGYYMCCASAISVGFDAETAGDEGSIKLVKNGTSISSILDFDEINDPNTSLEWGFSGCGLITLTVDGDYVEVYGGHTDATTACTGAGSNNQFSCRRFIGSEF